MYIKQKAFLTVGVLAAGLIPPFAGLAGFTTPTDAGAGSTTPKPAQHVAPDNPAAGPPPSEKNNPAPSAHSPITYPGVRQADASRNAPTKPAHPEQRVSNQAFEASGKTYPLRTYKTLITPNDPYATQWWTTTAALPAAWDYGTGTGTKIAIIDTGFALAHEEFTGRWLTNPGEQGTTAVEADSPINCSSRDMALDKSCNAIDDDGNGFTDDVMGWDFYSDVASVQAGKDNPAGASVSHGTGVAGVAAATGDNGRGIAGVSWAAKILPLQAMNDDGVGDTLTIARAITYATDRGVDVINLSLGSEEPDDYLRSTIRYAIEHGVVVVAAAGNDGCDCMVYPARYPEVVGVGALASDGTAAGFSSYGASLDLLAPGSGVRTTAWSAGSPTNSYSTSVAGTSFASPFVAGLLANARGLQPDATWGELINAMLSQADHKTLTAANPYSTTLGFGAVHAGNLMQRIGSPFSETTRHDLRLINADSLDADSAKECAGGFPTAPFYQISLPNRIYYTISPLEVSKQSPANVSQKGYVCTHLPTDATSVVRRIISSPQEFSGASPKVSQP